MSLPLQIKRDGQIQLLSGSLDQGILTSQGRPFQLRNASFFVQLTEDDTGRSDNKLGELAWRFVWHKPVQYRARVCAASQQDILVIIYFKEPAQAHLAAKAMIQAQTNPIVQPIPVSQQTLPPLPAAISNINYMGLIQACQRDRKIYFSLNFLRALRQISLIKREIVYKQREQLQLDNLFTAVDNILEDDSKNKIKQKGQKQKQEKSIFRVFQDQLNKSQTNKQDHHSSGSIQNTFSPNRLLFQLKRKISVVEDSKQEQPNQSFYKFKLQQNLYQSMIKQDPAQQNNYQEFKLTKKQIIKLQISEPHDSVMTEGTLKSESYWTQKISKDVTVQIPFIALLQVQVYPPLFPKLKIRGKQGITKTCQYNLSKIKKSSKYHPEAFPRWPLHSLPLEISFGHGRFYPLALKEIKRGMVSGLTKITEGSWEAWVVLTVLVEEDEAMGQVAKVILPVMRLAHGYRVSNYNIAVQKLLSNHNQTLAVHRAEVASMVWQRFLFRKQFHPLKTLQFLMLSLGSHPKSQNSQFPALCDTPSKEDYQQMAQDIATLKQGLSLEAYRDTWAKLCQQSYIAKLKTVRLVVTAVRVAVWRQLVHECYKQALFLARLLVDRHRGLALPEHCISAVIVSLIITRHKLQDSQPFWSQVVQKAGCKQLSAQKYWLLQYMPYQFLKRMLSYLLFLGKHKDFPALQSLMVQLVKYVKQQGLNFPYHHDERLPERVGRLFKTLGDGQQFFWGVAEQGDWKEIAGGLFSVD